MGYTICKLQNVSEFGDEKPDIMVDESEPGWDDALKNWKDGKNPTKSPFWKKGIFALTKEKEGV